jgi:hypothetical protein
MMPVQKAGQGEEMASVKFFRAKVARAMGIDAATQKR